MRQLRAVKLALAAYAITAMATPLGPMLSTALLSPYLLRRRRGAIRAKHRPGCIATKTWIAGPSTCAYP
jgi:hypothetical protein